ncbi:MAG: helix-turn-helix domain-containing protein [Chitinophagales bacterium]|nr:helix-turn-helix domain-containing protein [Chitinophagales bacterium]
MFSHDNSNENFRLAAELINNTSQNIFLTGKAGSGKTTFLKHIQKTTHKNCVVVAPTGVAAINAGGVTMHSLFQLPFEPFIPVRGNANSATPNQNNLLSKIHLGNSKRELMEELELLIIDEVSMVRCDQLDAIDTILRVIRKQYRVPFGGVQVLFIGDMYQLPPVIKDDEWQILKEYYEGPFFFHAKVIEHEHPVYIELKKIYRQKEQRFIDLLNNIRNNNAGEYDFELLHSRYFPAFKPAENEKYVTITTHNYKADAINQEELRKLKVREYVFKGEVEGDFSDRNYPAELNLVLKEGAQVMFIKNDSGEFRKYFNGKLATVKNINADEIVVTMNDDQSAFTLQREEWENIRYTLNKETGGIKEEVLGSFRQYPVRLAWAITIHKSQGLTFDRIIIDAGQSFAPGQVYVALSRCTTLEGMILLSRISSRVIGTDERIVAFAKRENHEHELQEILERERRAYLKNKLIEAFNWNRFIKLFEDYVAYVPEKTIPDKQNIIVLSGQLLLKIKEHGEVAEKFKEKIPALIELYERDKNRLMEDRVGKAIHWFGKNIHDDILQPLLNHYGEIQHASKVKQYKKYVNDLLLTVEGHLKKLFSVRYGDVIFCADETMYKNYIPQSSTVVPAVSGKKEKGKKVEKGESHRQSLHFYQEGLSISEIAKIRNLASSTIEGHLGQFVLTGEVDIYKMLPEQKVKTILKVLENPSMQNISILRSNFGSDFSYGEIRAVLNHWQRMQQVKVLS